MYSLVLDRSTISPYGTGWFVAFMVVTVLTIQPISSDEVVTSPESAQQLTSFQLQGEYRGTLRKSPVGLQVLHVDGDTFHGYLFAGGLPGNGNVTDLRSLGNASAQNGSLTFESNDQAYRIQGGQVLIKASGNQAIGRLNKVRRTSPTLGNAPPKQAVHLFDGSGASLKHWKNGEQSENGFLKEGTHTKQKFGDFKLHMEFRLPYKPGTKPGDQSRGNSGVYIYDRYEIQLLDTYGLPYYRWYGANEWKEKFKQHLGYSPGSGRSRWCGAFYKYRSPKMNATYPPLSWQTYDIEFRAPRIKNGKKVQNARIKVWHNGVKIHDRELERGTGSGKGKSPVREGSIYLQDHNNPVRFRNIWILEQ
jgi:hypothetical protein